MIRALVGATAFLLSGLYLAPTNVTWETNVEHAFAKAKENDRPLLIVFR